MTATVEGSGETVSHDVHQCYRVDGTLVEFIPIDNVPGYRYRLAIDGTKVQEWVSESKRPSKPLAAFYYEKYENDRYVMI